MCARKWLAIFFLTLAAPALAAVEPVVDDLMARYPIGGGTLRIDPGHPARQFEFGDLAGTRASMDWRNHNGQNWLTPVKDQGSCGACWAFSTAAAFEAQVKIENNRPLLTWDLSERFAEACYSGTFPYNDPSCILGWYAELALDQMAAIASPWVDGTPGICPEACYPYGTLWHGIETGPCGDTACPTYLSERVYLDGWSELWPAGAAPGNADALIKNVLNTHGPVVVRIEMPNDSLTEPDWIDFYTYWGTADPDDVWSGPDGPCTVPPDDCGGHGLLIVGYDDAAPTPYWIVKNSWGDFYMDGGYFRMAMGYDNSYVWYHPLVVDAPAVTNVPATGPIGAALLLAAMGLALARRKVGRRL